MAKEVGLKYVYAGPDNKCFAGSYLVTEFGIINLFDSDGQSVGTAQSESHARRILRDDYERTRNLIRVTSGPAPSAQA